MNTIHEILQFIEARGLSLMTDGTRIGVVPSSLLSPEVRLLLRDHRCEIVKMLRGDGDKTSQISQENDLLSPSEDGRGTATHGVGFVESTYEPIECVRCGAIDCWWNAVGQRRCAACDPPSKTAQRYLETHARMQREGKCRNADAAANVGGLIGCGFPPVPVTEPPPEITADPIVHCIACHDGRVLPGLPWTSKQLCYACYARLLRPGSPQCAMGDAT